MSFSSLSCGIVGLPNVGKSTLFNALAEVQAAEASNYPFCTIEPNTAIVNVDDARLPTLSAMSKSKDIHYAKMRFVDIAGLVAGASKGEGLGNKFLANIREVDAILHVVRCFDSSDIVHVSGKVDPISDIEVINIELGLADLQMAENLISRLEKQVKGNKEVAETVELLKRVRDKLNDNIPVRVHGLTLEEQELLKPYPFLTAKTVIYVPNVSENDLPEMNNEYVKKVEEYAKKEGSLVIPICAKIEEEIALLPKEERAEFLEAVGLKDSGLHRLIKAAFSAIGLITYLTTGEIETRAWTILKGTTAPVAAGKIHSDIQKGFIRAEVVAFEDMVKYGGRAHAREAGKVRAEGKEYIVKDGDVILFMHN